MPIEHVRTFAGLMRKNGDSCRIVEYAGKVHAFFNYGRDGNVPFIDTVRETDRFLASLGYIEGEPKL